MLESPVENCNVASAVGFQGLPSHKNVTLAASDPILGEMRTLPRTEGVPR